MQICECRIKAMVSIKSNGFTLFLLICPSCASYLVNYKWFNSYFSSICIGWALKLMGIVNHCTCANTCCLGMCRQDIRGLVCLLIASFLWLCVRARSHYSSHRRTCFGRWDIWKFGANYKHSWSHNIVFISLCSSSSISKPIFVV